MAEHNMQISLSSSSNDSSDQETPFTTAMNPTIDTGGSFHQQTPTDSPQPYRKPRGRPPGSKNKPKPPLVITQDNEQAMKPAIIEVAAGTDVLQAVIQFAVRLRSCLTILSGSGTIAVATLHYPVCQSPAFTLHGPFSLLTLTGTFFFPPSPPPPRPPTPPLPISIPIASSSSSNPNPNQLETPTPASTFGITLAGMQGQIFGGIIGGKVIAGGDGVKIVASLFKNPELHRAAGILLEADDDVEDDDNNGDGNSNGGGDHGAGSSGGAAAENVSGFNVPNPMTMNPQHSDPSFMPWNHPSHPRPLHF
ncbi:unnamed protein product [Lathyrus sativus]|nr:unnamed protein product [Lathyrus sativus]